MEDGWRPETEWEGEAEDWVGAKEFNFRGELMTRISSQTNRMTDMQKKTDELTSALHVLGEHHKKTAETEHKRILAALKKEKVIALEDGDIEAQVEIDERISDLKESKKEESTVVQENKQALPPEITAWMGAKENAWYHNDPLRKGIADVVSDTYMRENPNGNLTDMLKHVDKVVRQEMPHKFNNQNNQRPSSVTESSGGRKPKKTKFTSKDLDDEQKEVAKTFVSQGVFDNVQAFVDELVNNGDLG